MLESYLILSGALVNALILLAVFAYLAGWMTFTFALDQLDDDDYDPSKEDDDLCKSCKGSGEAIGMAGAGPDAYEVAINCPKCGGTGIPQRDVVNPTVEELRQRDKSMGWDNRSYGADGKRWS